MSTPSGVDAPETVAVAMLDASETDDGRRSTRPRTAMVKTKDVVRTFNQEQSAGLFVGVSSFFDAYGQPSSTIREVPYAVDDAVDLAALFSFELELIPPDKVHLALAGEPKKDESKARLKRLKDAGAKLHEARFITVLALLEAVLNLTREDGILITSFATHGCTSGGHDYLLCQDSFLAQPQVTSLCVQHLLGQMQQPDSTSASRRLVLLDACRELIKANTRAIQGNTLSESFIAALAEARGTAVLTGTVVGGFSYDDAKIQNGVFTSAVCAGLRGGAPFDERGFITPETLCGYVNDQVTSWVMKNRESERGKSTGISKMLDGACAKMPLAVNREKWDEWSRAEYLRTKPTALQIEEALVKLEGLLVARAPVLLKELSELRGQVTRAGEQEAALGRLDVIALETLKISFSRFARGEEPAVYTTRDAFPGARAFLEEEADFFFGRDELIAQLVATLDTTSVVILTGRAGCGKTSLIRAGLVPALRKKHAADFQYIEVTMTTDGPYLPPLEEALLQRKPDCCLLLFLDRFSEARDYGGDADVFFQRIMPLIQDPSVRVVVDLREDAVEQRRGSYAYWWAEIPLTEGARGVEVHVAALEGRDLQNAIEQQVSWGGAVLTPPKLAERIVREVQDQRCRMALVQRTLDELHHRRHGDLLSEAEYDGMGGIDGALRETAEKIYLASNAAEQGVIEALFTNLIRLDPEDPARDDVARMHSIDLEPSGTPEDIATVLHRLDEERLILTERTAIDITHKRLLDTWPRLRDWRIVPASRSFSLSRQEVRAAVNGWLRKRIIAHRGDHLTALEALRGDPRLGLLERAYLERCFELRDLERRSIVDERLKDLAQMGWGVIFPAVEPDSEAARQQAAIRDALAPLFNLRRTMVNNTLYYRDIAGKDGYQPGESKAAFLARQGASPGSVDPAKLPYYLLLVGDPSVISFDFQCQLDIQHAVGRIHFDTIDEYASYARSLISIEGKDSIIDGWPSADVFFFAPRHTSDATTATTFDVVRAIVERNWHNWYIPHLRNTLVSRDVLGSRAQLIEHFTTLGSPRPSLLVTAGYGLPRPGGDSQQSALQGALVCEDGFFAAADVPTEGVDHRAMVALFWSSFSAGTLRMENDRLISEKAPCQIAPRPMVSALAQRLLGKENGAAAVIGMVQRAAAFELPGNEKVLRSFEKVLENVVTRLLSGYPVGAALDFFNRYYVELAADLHVLLEADDPSPEQAQHIKEVAAAARDARSFVVIGDPAARIPIDQ